LFTLLSWIFCGTILSSLCIWYSELILWCWSPNLNLEGPVRLAIILDIAISFKQVYLCFVWVNLVFLNQSAWTCTDLLYRTWTHRIYCYRRVMHSIISIRFYYFLFSCWGSFHFLILARHCCLLSLQFSNFLASLPIFLILNLLFFCLFFKEFTLWSFRFLELNILFLF
jgi:hypothetical protein